MIRNPECCVSPLPMCANRPLEHSRSKHRACSRGEPCSRNMPAGQGLPQPLGGMTPLCLDRHAPSRSAQTHHMPHRSPFSLMGGEAPAPPAGNSASHTLKSTCHTFIPKQHEIPVPLRGPGHPRNPQMGRRGQGETVFKTLQP